MLSALVAFTVLAPATPLTAQNGAAVVSRMLAYYNDAKTMTGTIKETVKAANESAVVTTQLQFEKPGKLYIRQQKQQGNRQIWLVVSNGKVFSYNAPLDGLNGDPNKRLVEDMVLENYKMTIHDVYVAAVASLGDRSAPLDIAIGRKDDLKYLRDQWATVEYRDTTEYEGEKVHVVMGQWRRTPSIPPTGQYRMFITDNGELKQFSLSETMVNELNEKLTIVSTWDVKLVKNGKPDSSLFKVQ